MGKLGDLWSDIIVNNSLNDLWIALAVFVGVAVGLKIFDVYIVYYLKKLAKKTETYWDDVIIGFLKKINFGFYAFLGFYLGTLYLELPPIIDTILSGILVVLVAYYASRGLTSIASHALEKYRKKRKKEGKGMSDSMANVMKVIAKVIIWSVVLLMVLSNFGVEVTPLIASLGVGGVAIAFALQAVLGDLFAAFAIYFDRPFEEGDFLIVGNDMGTVKHIGIKTTRLEALGGEELVVANSDMTSSRVNNYKRMKKRRIVFSFGVEYNTSAAKLKKVKKAAEKAIKDVDKATLDRVHFKDFGDSALNFEAVYYVESNDYSEYMDIQEKINLKLKENVEKLGVGFAFPTRTVHLFDHGKTN